jgi:hypothetical protein
VNGDADDSLVSQLGIYELREPHQGDLGNTVRRRGRDHKLKETESTPTHFATRRDLTYLSGNRRQVHNNPPGPSCTRLVFEHVRKNRMTHKESPLLVRLVCHPPLFWVGFENIDPEFRDSCVLPSCFAVD